MFPLCAVRRVGTCWYLCSFVVLRPCSRLASFLARSWQEGGDIYVLRNCCQYFLRVSLSFRMFFLSGPTLRVAPAETRLTVYRRSNILLQWGSVSY